MQFIKILPFSNRYNATEYNFEVIRNTTTVLGEIYRHILYDEVVPDINQRPTLFEMSWHHQEHCNDTDYPKGTWNCTETAKTFIKLNKIYDFYNVHMRSNIAMIQ